ncbi:hypothetical protein J3R30DRAFT_3404428 [Lentinula aciculospora]|uniref:Uncharacterized protein n=1 Tax=Lentinula aciculospora TaxID=153920 RepID=A0A9W9DN50_9AGAR|nr:hypothetical protein J3R30DRAFT_3404428 [Lentinula aciculospora]
MTNRLGGISNNIYISHSRRRAGTNKRDTNHRRRAAEQDKCDAESASRDMEQRQKGAEFARREAEERRQEANAFVAEGVQRTFCGSCFDGCVSECSKIDHPD